MPGDTPNILDTRGWGMQPPDRRKRRRFQAHWHLRMWGIARDAVQAYTTDVSSGGFYCRSPRPFLPGDKLTALLDIPNLFGDVDSTVLVLHCEVAVLRVEPIAHSDDWGLACQILDYSVLRAAKIEVNGAASVKNGDID